MKNEKSGEGGGAKGGGFWTGEAKKMRPAPFCTILHSADFR
jgi:hypothetical protein